MEEYVELPERLVGGAADFLLRVKGDSMIDAGILDGDLVVVRRQTTATNGEIVVALAGEDETADEATVKRYFRENGRIRLQPENDGARADLRAARPDPRQGGGGVPGAVTVAPLNRTLDQEVFALLRGASLECLVCGEFVLHRRGEICCPECGMSAGARRERSRIGVTIRLAGRVTAERSAGSCRLEESPDTAGQDAGETPGGESRRKVAQKGDRLRRRLSGDAGGKGEKVR